jgi:hypothetical protein
MKALTEKSYGTELSRRSGTLYSDPGRVHIIGRIEKTGTGNAALSIGSCNREGWEKTAHVTLTPNEALGLAIELLHIAVDGGQIQGWNIKLRD